LPDLPCVEHLDSSSSGRQRRRRVADSAMAVRAT
jgi:hypothetical protein